MRARSSAPLAAAALVLAALFAPAAAQEPRPGPFAPARMPSLDGSPVSFVIVTNAEMAPEFERLAAWRTRSGLPAAVRTIEEILAHYHAAGDVAARMRLFLQDAHSLWGSRWVLLGGDSDVLAPRYVRTTYYGGADLLCDLYFAGLDGSWNANGNAVFGEAGTYGDPASGDVADLRPDVYVGRAPVSTLEEARIFVDKTLAYETSPPSGNATRILQLAEVLFPSDWQPGGAPPQVDGANLTESAARFLPPSFHRTRLYQNHLAWPGSFLETRQAAIDSLNAGFGWVHHVGHGFRFNMSVGDASLANADADALTNGGRTFVLYALNCTSAAFSFNCITERFMTNGHGGSVAVIGSTDLDFPSTSINYQDEFFRNVFERGYGRLGECYARANETFAYLAEYGEGPHRWTQFTMALFGDPTLPLWTAEPRLMVVSYDATLPLGSSELEVTVASASAPLEGATVTIEKTGEAYGSAETGPDGVAHVPFWPRTQGEFTVAVTAPGHVPFDGSATASAAASAHIVLADPGLAPSGGAAKGFAGNAPIGLPMLMNAAFRNEGSQAAEDLTVNLSSADPYVVLADSSVAIPDIQPGATAAVSVPLAFALADETPEGRRVILLLEVVGSSGLRAGEEVEVIAVAPRLRVAGQSFEPGFGQVNARIWLVLENAGSSDATMLEAVLTRLSGVDGVVDSTVSIGAIALGSTATAGPFSFDAAGDDPRFLLSVTDPDRTLIDSVIVDIAPTAPPSALQAWGGSGSIRLTWSPPVGADDLYGYRVWRAASPSGPFAEITTEIIRDGAVYEDLGLPATTAFSYRVTAVDLTGNESAPSDVANTSTAPPMESGWPTTIALETSSSPGVADLDEDGIQEIVVGGDKMYVFHPDGTELIDGDDDIGTLGVFASDGYKYWASPAVGDVDGDGSAEIVCCSWQDTEGQSVQIGRLYVWRADGRVAAGWPRAFIGSPALPWATPALGDLDGNGTLEIVVPARGYVYAFHFDGTEVRNGDADPGTVGVFLRPSGADYQYGSAAVVDLDGDMQCEIIFTDRSRAVGGYLHVMRRDGSYLPGFPFALGSNQCTSSPAVADIDGDADLEIVFGCGDNVVYALHANGTAVSGWPRTGVTLTGNTDFQSSPAVGDVDGDGNVDVVIGSNDGKLHAFRGQDGTPLPGFPRALVGSTLRLSSPVIGEIDGDRPEREIMVAAHDGKIYAVNHDGSGVPGFPYPTAGEIPVSVSLGDADQDGLQNVVFQSKDQNVYLLEFPGVEYIPAENPWPMFRQNMHRNGYYDPRNPVAVALASVRATAEGNGVRVRWRSGVDGIVVWSVLRGRRGADPDLAVPITAEPVVTRGEEEADAFDPGPLAREDLVYWLDAVLPSGVPRRFGPFEVATTVRAASFKLMSPNPFRPSVTFRVEVPDGERVPASVRIYDVRGRLVREVIAGWLSGGIHDIAWDGRDESGRRAPGGVYFVRAQVAEYAAAGRLVKLE